MNSAVIVGLTGGIGSGKSTVARVFEVLGIPVFYADRAGINAYAFEDVRSAVTSLLGLRAYRPDGSPDRAYIAEQVFSDPDKLAKLNAIIHPAVRQQFENWLNQHRRSEIVVREAAILFETNTHRDCAFTISVEADEALRIERVLKRGQQSEADVRARIKRQWTRAQRAAIADFILENDGMRAVIPQLLEMLDEIKSRHDALAHKH